MKTSDILNIEIQGMDSATSNKFAETMGLYHKVMNCGTMEELEETFSSISTEFAHIYKAISQTSTAETKWKLVETIIKKIGVATDKDGKHSLKCDTVTIPLFGTFFLEIDNDGKLNVMLCRKIEL